MQMFKAHPACLQVVCQESNRQNAHWESKQEILRRRFELFPECCTHWQEPLHLWIMLHKQQNVNLYCLLC